MKKNSFKKNIIKGFTYKEELQEELRNNSIVLSFAISIIIIGIISIFYHNNSTFLVGRAISSLLLTLIQCFSNGNTMLNILPVFTLLIFGFFQKSVESIPIINILLREQLRNFIIFLSFSLTFLTQAYKNIIFRHDLKEINVKYNEEKNKMIYSELEIIKIVKDKTMKIKKVAQEKNMTNEAFNRSMKDLLDYVEDETFKSNVKSTLITKGSEDKKVTFNIEEVEESIILNSNLVRNRSINANNIEED